MKFSVKNTRLYRLLKGIYHAGKKIIFIFQFQWNALIFFVKSLQVSSKYDQQKVICCMSNPCVIGGTELQFKLVSRTLQEKGLLKMMLTTGTIDGGKHNQIYEMKKDGVLYLSAGILTGINYKKHRILRGLLTLILQRFNTPILHIFNTGAAPLIPAAKQAGMRVIYTETGLPQQGVWWGHLAPYIDDLDHVISVSEEGLTSLRREFGYKGPGTVISSLIESPPYVNRTHNFTMGALNLVYFGRIDIGKGVDILLRAFKEVLLLSPDTTLTLIGTGLYLKEIRKLSRELKMSDKIRFCGHLNREALFEEIGKADVFCLPSLSEGSPCCIIEAMAIGLPVIATRVGGIPELVIDGKTGLLISPNDVKALERAILQLANDPELRVKMGNNALKLYQERLSHHALMQKLISIYQMLTNPS